MIEPSDRHREIAQAVFCESVDGHASWITRVAQACAQAAAEERDKWQEDNFALAANQCHAGYGDDYGNHRCRYQDEVATVRAEEREACAKIAEKREEPGTWWPVHETIAGAIRARAALDRT